MHLPLGGNYRINYNGRTLTGDVDSDGGITISDVTELINMLLQTE